MFIMKLYLKKNYNWTRKVQQQNYKKEVLLVKLNVNEMQNKAGRLDILLIIYSMKTSYKKLE